MGRKTILLGTLVSALALFVLLVAITQARTKPVDQSLAVEHASTTAERRAASDDAISLEAYQAKYRPTPIPLDAMGTDPTKPSIPDEPDLETNAGTGATDASVVLTFDCSAVSEIPLAECEALAALYQSTNGDSWLENSGWLTTVLPCSWYGVYCTDGHVSRVDLADNSLSGTLPWSIAELTELVDLQLRHNQIGGSIPAALGSLGKLELLDLDSNLLTGSIPSEIGDLSNLRYMSLGSNQLTGSIPASLGDLSALQDLTLGTNQLSGSLPPELGELTDLRWMVFQGNGFSGAIPANLRNLASIESIWLNFNDLSGLLPPEIGTLASLKSFLLAGNVDLVGPVPQSFSNLANAEVFDIGYTTLCAPGNNAFRSWIDGTDYYYDAARLCSPMMLVPGWEAKNSLDLDTGGFAVVRPHLETYGYYLNENLFYAGETTADEGLAENARRIYQALCNAYPTFKLINPEWTGRFDVVGHSYGGLRARAFLEEPLYYIQKSPAGSICFGSNNQTYGVYVNNLFTLGSPHGGGDADLAGALRIGLGHLLDARSSWELMTQIDNHNDAHSQPDGVCYRLIGGNAMEQWESLPWWRDLYKGKAPNDLGVYQESAHALVYSWSEKYPNTVAIPTSDSHGYLEQNINSYFHSSGSDTPARTFDSHILPYLGLPASRCGWSAPSAAKRALADDVSQPTRSMHTIELRSASIDEGASQTGAFYLQDEGNSEITLVWSEGQMEFLLSTPKGEQLTPETAAISDTVSFLSMNLIGKSATYFLTDTITGTWGYTVTAASLPRSMPYVLLTKSTVPVTLLASAREWQPLGEAVPISGSLFYSQTEPLIDSTLVATVYAPNGVTDTISLYDDGSHGDSLAGDGLYGNLYNGASISGVYGVSVEASGTLLTQAYTRTSTTSFTIAPDHAVLAGRYRDGVYDEDSDGYGEQLDVSVAISVTAVGTYTLAADLYASNAAYIGHVITTDHYQPGLVTKTLSFDGRRIYEVGQNGPYSVSQVMLLDAGGASLVLAEEAQPYATAAYDYRDFCTPPRPVTVVIDADDFGLLLHWNYVSPYNEQHLVHRAAEPYFSPGTDTLQAILPDTGTDYFDWAAAANDFFYLVQAQGCGETVRKDSQRVGIMHFSLTPGNMDGTETAEAASRVILAGVPAKLSPRR